MESFGLIEPQRYLWGTMIADIVIGIGMLVPVSIVALMLGGFSFIQPWLIVTPLAIFLMGWLRGRTFRKLSAKTLALAAPALLLFGCGVLEENTAVVRFGVIIMLAALTVLPTAGGIKFAGDKSPCRRRRMS